MPSTTRALVVALACERPAERRVPLSRYSLSDLSAQVANVLGTPDGPARSSIWRWLRRDALRPWRYRCWICFDRQGTTVLASLHLASALICLRYLGWADAAGA